MLYPIFLYLLLFVPNQAFFWITSALWLHPSFLYVKLLGISYIFLAY